MDNSKRNLGLDIARSTAISCVLIAHSTFFIPSKINDLLGIFAVEIFFVLSGFLIGKIIIETLVENSSINSLKEFLIRRWFRTLPLYYLVLFLTSIIKDKSIPAKNLVFIQNFNENELAFLPISWSLSVEEWFYLLASILLIILLKMLNRVTNNKNIFYIFSIGFAVLAFILRSYIAFQYNPMWDYGIRKQIFLRMDSIMIGVILSSIKIYYNNLYKKIATSKLPIILSFIGYFAIGKYLLEVNLNNSILGKIFIFSALPIVSMFFILWLESNTFINNTFSNYKISKIITFVSIISYSLYLVHWNIFEVLSHRISGSKGLCIAIILTFLLAWFLNIAYEIPIMKLRDRFTFTNKK